MPPGRQINQPPPGYTGGNPQSLRLLQTTLGKK